MCFRDFVIQNFPFLEDDFDALTDYELFCKMVEYMRKALEDVDSFQEQLTAFNQELDYYENYFKNLDLQEEVNIKLNEMVEDGTLTALISVYVNPIINTYKEQINNQISEQNTEISNFKTDVNTEIGVIDAKVNSATSGSPLVASSTDDMTETDRVYVNTTDGKWYYYDGDSWEIGGTYQSTGLDENDVGLYNINTTITDELLEKVSLSNLGRFQTNNSNNTAIRTTPFFIKKGTIITVGATFLSKYQWRIQNYNGQGNTYIMTFGTRDTYTTTADYYASLEVQPITDTNWDINPYDIDLSAFSFTKDIYIKKRNTCKTYDMDDSLLANNISFTALYNENNNFKPSGGGFLQSNNRISMTKMAISNYPLFFERTSSSIQFAVDTYTSDSFDALENESGWLNQNSYIIPANKYFLIVIRKADGTNFDNELDLSKYIKLTSFANIKQLTDIENYTNSYEGNHIEMKQNLLNVSKIYDLSTPYSQGSDIYGNYLVIYFLDGSLNQRYFKLYNKNTGEYISKILANVEHGDCLQFSNEFYNENDLLPLLYCTSDTTPGKCFVYRFIDENNGEIVKEYDFPDGLGYYGGCTIDELNKRLYFIAYVNEDYRTSANNNKMKVTVFDMTQETLISDNKYSLAIIDQFYLPFIYCIQGQKLHNNKIFCISSYSPTEQVTTIKVIDPYLRIIDSDMNDMPSSIANYEFEDLSFIDNEMNKTDIWIRNRVSMYKITLN